MKLKLMTAALASLAGGGAYVDHEQFSVLGVYATTCTIVHGQ